MWEDVQGFAHVARARSILLAMRAHTHANGSSFLPSSVAIKDDSKRSPVKQWPLFSRAAPMTARGEHLARDCLHLAGDRGPTSATAES